MAALGSTNTIPTKDLGCLYQHIRVPGTLNNKPDEAARCEFRAHLLPPVALTEAQAALGVCLLHHKVELAGFPKESKATLCLCRPQSHDMEILSIEARVYRGVHGPMGFYPGNVPGDAVVSMTSNQPWHEVVTRHPT